jgi:hypothetical protein
MKRNKTLAFVTRARSQRARTFSACVLALTIIASTEPALAKDPEPYNPADAARKYCGRAYKRYCANVPPQGVQALDCLKQNVRRLSPACRKAVQQL